MASREIYKMLRKPNKPTTAKHEEKRYGKDGNPNRSMTFLTEGSSVYTSTGFLIKEPDLERIGIIALGDINSGVGKKNELEIPEMSISEKKKEINKLIKNEKMGGGGFSSEKNKENLYNYNEFTYRLRGEDVQAIYFTTDPTVHGHTLLDFSYLSGLGIHPFTPILEAIFLQQEYFKQTGIKLPIFEYSGLLNFCKKIPDYSNEEIIGMFREIARHFISYQLSKGVFHDNFSIDMIKVFMSYGREDSSTRPYAMILSLDSNFDESLKNKISSVIKEVRNNLLHKDLKKEDVLIREEKLSIFSNPAFFRLIYIPKRFELFRDLINDQLNNYLNSEQFQKDSASLSSDFLNEDLNRLTTNTRHTQFFQHELLHDRPLLKVYVLALLVENKPVLETLEQTISFSAQQVLKKIKTNLYPLENYEIDDNDESCKIFDMKNKYNNSEDSENDGFYEENSSDSDDNKFLNNFKNREPTFSEFKEAFEKSCAKDKFLFFLPPSEMMQKMNSGLIKNMSDVKNHILENPTGRSAKVLEELENNDKKENDFELTTL